MNFQRRAGVLLHPTSLPSKGGIGDMGPAAYAFVDFLHDAGQGLWQVLPLNPVGLGNSPYSATSAFAGCPLLISLERLAEHGWIGADELKNLPVRSGRVDFPKVNAVKFPLLRKAAGVMGGVAVLGYLTYLEVWELDVFKARLLADPYTEEDEAAIAKLGI